MKQRGRYKYFNNSNDPHTNFSKRRRTEKQYRDSIIDDLSKNFGYHELAVVHPLNIVPGNNNDAGASTEVSIKDILLQKIKEVDPNSFTYPNEWPIFNLFCIPGSSLPLNKRMYTEYSFGKIIHSNASDYNRLSFSGKGFSKISDSIFQNIENLGEIAFGKLIGAIRGVGYEEGSINNPDFDRLYKICKNVYTDNDEEKDKTLDSYDINYVFYHITKNPLFAFRILVDCMIFQLFKDILIRSGILNIYSKLNILPDLRNIIANNILMGFGILGKSEIKTVVTYNLIEYLISKAGIDHLTDNHLSMDTKEISDIYNYVHNREERKFKGKLEEEDDDDSRPETFTEEANI